MMNSKIEVLVKKLLNGNTVAAAKLITKVENSDLKEEIIKEITPHTGNAYTVGITGSPGVGKSTLTDKLVKKMRSQDKKIGIIAVDPTSPFSGGAILGDRIRLQEHSTDAGVFIRSMASRGHLGGISSATSDAVKILDAYGCDYIFIETVGVGQSEIEIVKNVDTTLLLLVPGMGDEIQAIKAGVMEIADIFVVNKADKDGADRTVLEIEMLQNLSTETRFKAPIQKVVARDNVGIDQLVRKIEKHKDFLQKNELFHENRRNRLKMELKQSVHDKLLERTTETVEENYDISKLITELYDKKMDIYTASNSIISKILK
jgi:GTPase